MHIYTEPSTWSLEDLHLYIGLLCLSHMLQWLHHLLQQIKGMKKEPEKYTGGKKEDEMGGGGGGGGGEEEGRNGWVIDNCCYYHLTWIASKLKALVHYADLVGLATVDT